MTKKSTKRLTKQLSEKTLPRSTADIQKEYESCSAIAGDLGYRIDVMTAQKQQTHQRMFALNQERNAAMAQATGNGLDKNPTPQTTAPAPQVVA